MHRLAFCILLLAGPSQGLLAQYQLANWYIKANDNFPLTPRLKFGKSNWSSEVDTFPNKYAVSGGFNASISDTSGKLLFWIGHDGSSGGGGVFDKSNNLVCELSPISWSNPCLILTDPADTNIYWNITVKTEFIPTSTYLTKRNLVYMRYSPLTNNGQGQMLDSCAVKFFNPDINLKERMAATRDATGKGWWILAMQDLEDSIIVLKLDSTGLRFHNKQFCDVQASGDSINSLYGMKGYILFNRAGNAFIVNDKLKSQLFYFDRCSGHISYKKILIDLPIDSVLKYPYEVGFGYPRSRLDGISFSFSDSIAYINSFDTLYQVILNTDPLQVHRMWYKGNRYSADSTKFFIRQSMAINGMIFLAHIQNYQGWQNPADTFNKTISYIENPNLPYPQCSLKKFALVFPGITLGARDFPKYINYSLGPLQLPKPGSIPDTSTCIGQPVVLGLPKTDPAFHYQWWPSTGLSRTDTAHPTATVFAPTTYYVTIYTECGDTTQDTVEVNIIPPGPIPQAFAGRDTSFCSGQTLIIGTANTQAGLAFQWNPSQFLSDSTSPNPLASPPFTITYILKTTETTCGTVLRDSVTLTLLSPVAAPSKPAGRDTSFCPGDSVRIGLPSLPPGYSFTWQPTSSLSDPSSVNPKASPRFTTTYTLTLTEPNCGLSSSDSVTLTVLDSLLLPCFTLERAPALSSASDLKLYPNPTTGQLTLECAQAGQYQILDALGRPVRIGTHTAPSSQIKLFGLASGYYTLQLQTAKGTLTKAFSKVD